MHTTTQLVFAFIGGFLAGVCITTMAVVAWNWMEDRAAGIDPRHRLKRQPFPRKTTMPKLRTRVEGRPTNINEPPAEVRQAQFRARRETRE